MPPLLLLLPSALAAHPLEPAGQVELGVATAVERVPPFFSTPRERDTVFAAGSWRPDDRVGLHARIDAWRSDAYPDGERVSGPGDIRLGAEGYTPTRLLDVGLGTWVKLPNADDRLELGTDETDLGLDLRGRWRAGEEVLLQSGVGLEVLGDPTRVGRQAVAAASWFEVTGATEIPWFGRLVGTWGLHSRTAAGGDPGRVSLRWSVVRPCPVRVEVGAALGLTEGEGTESTLAIGWQSGCRAD